MIILRTSFVLFVLLLVSACGPVPPPMNAYQAAPDLIRDMHAKRGNITSFRITGRVDHFGEKHRVQGKTYFFSVLPQKLRVELVSPFGSPLTVLTVDESRFAMHDVREAKFYEGPADPCNIARLIRIPLPVADVIRILLGDTPLIEGPADVSWNRNGFYKMTIKGKQQTQILEIDGDHETLPLKRSTLSDEKGLIFDVAYSRWLPVGKSLIPHEIRVKMPREKADLLIKYDRGGVELNVEMPQEAWTQTPPAGLTPEKVVCE